MQFLLCLSLSLILANASVSAAVNTATRTLPETPKLQLSARIVEYVSCSPDGLRLRLSLKFTNGGTTNIILDKRSSVIGRYVVSRNLQELASGKFEADLRTEYDAGPSIPWNNNKADDSNFVKLAPGGIYETGSSWSNVFFIVNDGSPHSEAGLKYGSHVLQIEVGTWFFPSEEAGRRARRQFKGTGYLWTTPVKSPPLEFNVDSSRPISKCK
jgi:hypothetical protein